MTEARLARLERSLRRQRFATCAIILAAAAMLLGGAQPAAAPAKSIRAERFEVWNPAGRNGQGAVVTLLPWDLWLLERNHRTTRELLKMHEQLAVAAGRGDRLRTANLQSCISLYQMAMDTLNNISWSRHYSDTVLPLPDDRLRRELRELAHEVHLASIDGSAPPVDALDRLKRLTAETDKRYKEAP